MRKTLRRLGLLLILALLGVTGFAFLRLSRRESPPPVPPGVDTVSAGVHSVQLWFGSPAGDSLVLEPRDVVEAATLHQRVADLVAELERGPRRGGVRTLPAGTALLHAYMDDRGLLTLDLSRAFQQNFRGGSGAEYLAIASLVRTAASNLPEVKRVMIVCGGVPLGSLAGHLPLDRPLDVSDWP
jgi:spore germination protein GerM